MAFNIKGKRMSLKASAIRALCVLVARQKKYDAANKVLRKLSPDFPQRAQCIDDEVCEAFVGLIDEILGDNLASYYLFDMPRSGGTIIDERGKHEIKTLKDLLKYAEGK